MVSRIITILVCLMGLISLGQALCQQQAGPPLLGQKLEILLPKWDANKNGRLDRAEVESLLRDESIRGDDAAALACAHFWFLKSPAKNQASIQEITLPLKESLVIGLGSISITFDLNREYLFYKTHLASTNFDVFGPGSPTLKGIAQGHLGNCFFVSMMGAMANCNPDGVRSMIMMNEDKSITVKFPDGRSTRIVRIPDVLIALGSRTGSQGIWLNVLEEAYGEVYKTRALGDSAVLGIDRLSRGGVIGETIELLTGNKSETTVWKPGVPEDLLNVRYLLSKGKKSKSLMGAGVPLDLKKPPPGIVVAHAYAILDFDEKTDRMTLWNPHGNNFKPMGDDGFVNGYTTEGGVFTLPTRDFSFLFKSLFVENRDSKPKSGLK